MVKDIYATGVAHSMDTVKGCYAAAVVSKEDFASALRAHQAAVDDATKSPQREAAAAKTLEAAQAAR